MYCGLCEEACPTKPPSIYFTREFEGAEFNINKLVYVYVPPDETERRIKLAKEYKQKLAQKKRDKGN
jgi:formate hydrogenlyase subunit 6/NADH:ubiquinone oxidoreductase subunit I